MRRLVLCAGAAIVVLGGLLAGYGLYIRHEGRDIRGSSTVEFTPSAPPAVTPARSSAHNGGHTGGVAWPTYGFSADRLRFAVGVKLRPPFRSIWSFDARALLEFPPALGYGRVYLPTFDGRFYALDAQSGKTIWARRTGRCGWASPALDRHLVFITFLGHSCGASPLTSDGLLIAWDATTGRLRWRRLIGPVESSPLVAHGLVYVGDWHGYVYAFAEKTGQTRWVFRAGGKIKSSPALSGRRLYIGSYDGHLYALDARSGREIWRSSAQPRLGSPGTFYSTPAVAYGRVYIGSTDGKVYSYGAASGKLRWSHSTGGYVYAGPAVWRQLVLVGSYDHTFYAFDAATGAERWRFLANGPISGSATVLNGIVYFSTFSNRTYALSAATGRLVWTWPDGRYSPVVADQQLLYLAGVGRLYALVEARQRGNARACRTAHTCR